MKTLLSTTALAALLLAACAPEAEEAPAVDTMGEEESAADTMMDGEGEAGAEMNEPMPEEPVSDEETASMDAAGSDMDAILADARRDGDRARDEFRNPAETLAFFEVEPNHVVAEALPGGGWYSRVILPYVSENGGYYAINYPMAVFEQLFSGMNDETRARLAGWEESFPQQAGEWGGEVDAAFRFGAVPAELEGTADRVLYIRALHNLARTGNLDVAASDAFALLKPGGVLGVVQHRAPADETDERASGDRGYLREADVVAAMEAAGFVLEGSSDINANPNDTAAHEPGVWALPPTNAGDSEGQDVEPLQSVGESDRMTLKFRKPE
ncbi:MAG: class I SAM-dependent methyltransferase [Oceanicaulis sp.]